MGEDTARVINFDDEDDDQKEAYAKAMSEMIDLSKRLEDLPESPRLAGITTGACLEILMALDDAEDIMTLIAASLHHARAILDSNYIYHSDKEKLH